MFVLSAIIPSVVETTKDFCVSLYNGVSSLYFDYIGGPDEESAFSSYSSQSSVTETGNDFRAPTIFASLEPPDINSEPTPENVSQLRSWLNSNIAGQPLAASSYSFYEKIDEYLGPWGEEGYPIGYGKKYNVLFTSNEQLMSDSVSREWVEKTTVILQEELAEFIVRRYEEGTLGSLTEAELRRAAFDSHPTAYAEGGLSKVACLRPDLIPVISAIPSEEFIPTSESFGATVKQVATTAAATVPDIVGQCRIRSD